MAGDIIISAMPDPSDTPVEIVECKGPGHPDTLCDALAEQLSVSLSRFYFERFGTILHHNVDKVLLRGGVSAPRFGGGEVCQPIDIYLCGRAVRDFKGVSVPVDELAIEGTRDVLRRTFHALDADKHVRIHCLVRPGSADLADLFDRQGRTGTKLANDSSIGVGYAPFSPLERETLALSRALSAPATLQAHPAFGEDTKVLAWRRGEKRSFTVACAICDQYVADLDAYRAATESATALMGEELTGDGAEITVNAADDPGRGSVYLTVTGTSAEAGDDGQTGRGNRLNGLITPGRPMTMESHAGKNPVSHVGKLYNHAACAITAAIVAEVPGISAAECHLASRIGDPVALPHLVHIRVAAEGGLPSEPERRRIESLAYESLTSLNGLWRQLIGLPGGAARARS